ncbi:DDE-type integrase/transposase/recombinase [Thiothrix winogradskyi]|uniref:DDE-type integrase/transposase/recombinase n=1 Tax=Thiothrix winogradskyi TaxID=96472 RepID=A0ABY3SVW3_9GAMM|nr:DDE-type integrase/transposase/recombinase [Thiothrix winogradskyi]UJS23578.1 DDE-type integrase/transposase/recombinase [Thiothrix winogradskyi]
MPRLRATRPNEVWTWDITKLATEQRGVYLSLYVVLDLYSRFIVAWMVSRKENSHLAKQLMQEASTRYRIGLGELTLHQDRGAPMTAHGYLDLMAELEITCSHSRPRVSNDNPFSESQFKTCKQQPDYPGRFASVSHAREWFADYVEWYNFDHQHSGLAFFTPNECSRIGWATWLFAAKRHCKPPMKPTQNGSSTVRPSLSCRPRKCGLIRHILTKRMKT